MISAIEDFTRIIVLSREASIQIKALNYRAMDHANLGDIDAALADWKAVIDRRNEDPRTAAQAYLNRGGQLLHLGRLVEADKDLTAALEWADVAGEQRFRALEGRAQVREGLGDLAAAATDIEAMLAMDTAHPEWRPELQAKVRSLKHAADRR